jgi:hypothetical protein
MKICFPQLLSPPLIQIWEYPVWPRLSWDRPNLECAERVALREVSSLRVLGFISVSLIPPYMHINSPSIDTFFCLESRYFGPWRRRCRPQWPRGLRRRSTAEHCWDCGFESQWGHGFLSCTVFVLSGRGLCDRPIPRPEESYQLWCVLECDQVKNSKPSTPTVNK